MLQASGTSTWRDCASLHSQQVLALSLPLRSQACMHGSQKGSQAVFVAPTVVLAIDLSVQ